jgi:hypothetical protein
VNISGQRKPLPIHGDEWRGDYVGVPSAYFWLMIEAMRMGVFTEASLFVFYELS